jgi:hypothetical protein
VGGDGPSPVDAISMPLPSVRTTGRSDEKAYWPSLTQSGRSGRLQFGPWRWIRIAIERPPFLGAAQKRADVALSLATFRRGSRLVRMRLTRL